MYWSRTGTRRALTRFRETGARLMISARGVLRTEGFRYALDNGAWTAFREFEQGKRSTPVPDLAAFQWAVDLLGADADFIVVPDIVMGGGRSLALSRAWLRRLRRNPKLRRTVFLIAVQDGMTVADVGRLLGPRVGIFVGGSTEWKEDTMAYWSRVAHERGAWCHVGRVNTGRRARLCDRAGVDSFDGSGPSQFIDCLRPILDGVKQQDLEGWISRDMRNRLAFRK
jgi:hypothetical protein